MKVDSLGYNSESSFLKSPCIVSTQHTPNLIHVSLHGIRASRPWYIFLCVYIKREYIFKLIIILAFFLHSHAPLLT